MFNVFDGEFRKWVQWNKTLLNGNGTERSEIRFKFSKNVEILYFYHHLWTFKREINKSSFFITFNLNDLSNQEAISNEIINTHLGIIISQTKNNLYKTQNKCETFMWISSKSYVYIRFRLRRIYYDLTIRRFEWND